MWNNPLKNIYIFDYIRYFSLSTLHNIVRIIKPTPYIFHAKYCKTYFRTNIHIYITEQIYDNEKWYEKLSEQFQFYDILYTKLIIEIYWNQLIIVLIENLHMYILTHLYSSLWCAWILLLDTNCLSNSKIYCNKDGLFSQYLHALFQFVGKIYQERLIKSSSILTIV